MLSATVFKRMLIYWKRKRMIRRITEDLEISTVDSFQKINLS